MQARMLIVAAVVTLAVGALPLSAQQAPGPETMTATGRLMRVDTTAKTITITTASDEQLKFSYSNTTQVTGDVRSVAGLATVSSIDVVVTYTRQGEVNVATEIFVQRNPGT